MRAAGAAYNHDSFGRHKLTGVIIARQPCSPHTAALHCTLLIYESRLRGQNNQQNNNEDGNTPSYVWLGCVMKCSHMRGGGCLAAWHKSKHS